MFDVKCVHKKKCHGHSEETGPVDGVGEGKASQFLHMLGPHSEAVPDICIFNKYLQTEEDESKQKGRSRLIRCGWKQTLQVEARC